MKIRNGFVSNSSSSSFCLYGYHVNDNEEFIEEIKNYIDSDKLNEIVYDEYYIDSYSLESYIKDDMISVISDYDDDIFIGVNNISIPEDMTLIQIKDYIISVINNKLGINIEKRKICWHEDCWMDN